MNNVGYNIKTSTQNLPVVLVRALKKAILGVIPVRPKNTYSNGNPNVILSIAKNPVSLRGMSEANDEAISEFFGEIRGQ